MPVLFHSPTAIQVQDIEDDTREVSVLASASDQAFVARSGFDINNIANPKTGKTDLIVRVDYPNIAAYDAKSAGDNGEVSVTGSIVFVSDHSVFANHLWDFDTADLTGKAQCGDIYIAVGIQTRMDLPPRKVTQHGEGTSCTSVHLSET